MKAQKYTRIVLFTILLLMVVTILLLMVVFWYPSLTKESMKTNNLIEKNVFQSWKTKELNEETQRKIDRQKARNPDYTFHLYDDNDIDHFVNTVYPGRISDAYNRLNIIVAKVDFWRYLVLYHYGGVYVDMDSEIECSLDDDLLQPDDEAVITQEGNEGVYVQWALVFRKGHPILKRTIDVVTNNIEQGKTEMIETTGPGAFTKALQEVYEETYGKPLLYVIGLKEEHVYKGPEGCTYRILGTDYNGLFSLEKEDKKILYKNKNHWRDEVKQKPFYK